MCVRHGIYEILLNVKVRNKGNYYRGKLAYSASGNVDPVSTPHVV